MKRKISPVFGTALILVFLVTMSCTFDYGETGSSERELPDLVMENVEYVRVRSADPIARFQAERAERYEKQGLMKLQNFIFEQYGERGEEVNVTGKAGNASVDIETGDIVMTVGVSLEVESEDIIIETELLDWRDDPRILSTGTEDEVNVLRENGTSFTGVGLRADARRRTFEFSGVVSGTFIHDDDESTALSGEDE
ncbi:MAG: LPS export ABC transporter periplasmic protein LptC [Treponema sp.]|nr:LPS export ABC transporter periplasmic protein LptC [Treponema sp.]